MAARTGGAPDGTLPVGFWGPPTGHPDWCEPNYQVTHYIAEFWNTMSSVPLIIFGLLGAVYAVRDGLEKRFVVSYLAIATIGCGSCAFHGSLLYTGQVMDELPMIYGVLCFLYALATKEREHRVRNAVGLLAYASVATTLYFTFGFECFLVMYISSVLLLCRLSYVANYPSDGSDKKGLLHNDKKEALFTMAACVYIGGFVMLWIPEQILCDTNTTVKHLYLHAWFHLTSTFGPISWTAFAVCNRCQELKSTFTVTHLPVTMMPYVRLKTAQV